MTNKSEDEKIFEAILVSAFRDAAIADMEEAKLCEPVTLSSKHLKEELRVYNRYEFKRKCQSITKNPFLRKAVAVVLVICCVGFATLVSMPEVRAAVVDAVIKFCDKYVSLDFTKSGSTTLTNGEYTFGYIPMGFELTNEYEDPMTKYYKFTNNEGKEFSILYTPSFMTLSEADIENSNYSEIEINGYNAYLFSADDCGEIKLIFSDGNNVFNIVGNISKEDVLKIAKKILK